MADHTVAPLELSGAKTNIRRGGSGEPMLYLHGANGASAWLPFMARLAESFDLIVPEHPGYGASEMPEWLDNIHDLAYFYLDFLEDQDLDGVHVVGSSLGGWTALEIAVRNTSRIKTLTLSAPAGIHVDGVEPGDSFLWSPEETMRHLVADPATLEKMLAHTPSDEEFDVMLKNRETTARLAWSPRFFDPHLAKWIHRIDRPTHIIWGAGDQLLPPAYADEFARLIKGAKKTIIPGCGHLPQVEKTDAFCATITDFIKEVRS
jgi:pimeloyl-ACP methyl ester carboxylesterase